MSVIGPGGLLVKNKGIKDYFANDKDVASINAQDNLKHGQNVVKKISTPCLSKRDTGIQIPLKTNNTAHLAIFTLLKPESNTNLEVNRKDRQTDRQTVKHK